MARRDWLRRQVSGLVDRRLGEDYLARSKALTVQENEYGYDSFGFNRDQLKYAMPLIRWLYRDYFRTQTINIENVPEGRVLLIANHSGQLPFDGLVIAASLLLDGKPPRIARSMLEHFVPSVPFVSYLFGRWGQITGTPENCRRLLNREEAILVFPEGARGISKSFTKRYQLQDFGLGFMRLALETNTPIVPIAVIGAEEQAPAINLPRIAKLLGAPAFPVVPYPPFIAALPLPVKYRVYFGEPMKFEGDADDDDEVLHEMAKTVAHRIQSLIYLGLRERKGVFR